LQQVMPNVRQVFVTEGGMGRLHAIVTIHQPKRGEGKRAIMLAMGQVNLLKLVIVVDDDIDPADWTQVEWALAARFRGQEDLIVIPGAKADRCEPQERDLTVTKIGIVATTQPGSPAGKFEFVRPPQAVWEKVQQELESY
jgi:UbiD family decarboxylase